ncbi:hypothetical protein [Nocardioides nematodiphilus]|uniref:hypothetical protein n=1 Tax=Nocardioides nematodiphilus TaxID=2849669 RepID=UPI001CD9958D|nr:hypothetical protein [Nocardioides nematodiphilus]MCA1983617.1 hypothetical protein [Nocardioides nematodiphilus]
MSPYGIPRLRVEVPTLEPDAVLLDQLVSLSSASAPAATSSRASSMKVLLAAAGVAAVATTTWAAGAVPGSLLPARPAPHPHTVVTPTPQASSGPTPDSWPPATRTPGASHPTSEAPGVHPTHRAGLLPPSLGDLFHTAPHAASAPAHASRHPHRRHHHVRRPAGSWGGPSALPDRGYDHGGGFDHGGIPGPGTPHLHAGDGSPGTHAGHPRAHHRTRSEESSPP